MVHGQDDRLLAKCAGFRLVGLGNCLVLVFYVDI